MKLSILIPSIKCREDLLERLMGVLFEQWHMNKANVELLTMVDDGEKSIGQKRQELLEQATGDYVCFIDDDDLVPEDYVEATLKALETEPDCVGWKMDRRMNGRPDSIQIHSLKFKEWGKFKDGTHYRTPNHLNPIRRELALQVGFKDLNAGEDKDYSDRIRPLLKTEVFLDRIMYTYLFRCIRIHEVTNARRRKGIPLTGKKPRR